MALANRLTARFTRRTRVHLGAYLLCLWLFITPQIIAEAVTSTDVKDDSGGYSLKVGETVEREISGGESHSYFIPLTSGQYLHLTVDQRGIDLIITLFNANGNKVIEVDSPNGEQGPEILSAIIDLGGVYRLDVRPLEKKAAPGKY